MIASSRIAKASALMLALAAHGALALTLAAPEAPQAEGSAGAAEVRLGNAFADMAAGTLAAQPAQTDAQVSEVERAAPQKAESLPPETLVQKAQGVTAEVADAAEPDRVEAEQGEKADRPLAALPDRVAVLPAQDVDKAEPLRRAKAEPSPPPREVERLTGAEPDNAAVERSRRPRMRDKVFEEAHKKADQERVKDRKAKPTRAGAKQNTRAGETTGTGSATATSSGVSGKKQAAGNAAASNFPGLVMRKLARAGKPRVNARGAAIVAFTISGSGGLASVSLAQSSGHAALDRAAVRLVRGAAPFPKPPTGARRSFSVEIKGG